MFCYSNIRGHFSRYSCREYIISHFAIQSDQSLVYPFTEEEHRKGIATLKNNNAAGVDDVLVEQLKHLGPRAHRWLHSMLNACFTENKIPKVWRQSRIIAIHRPGNTLRFQRAINQSHSYAIPINCTNDSF